MLVTFFDKVSEWVQSTLPFYAKLGVGVEVAEKVFKGLAFSLHVVADWFEVDILGEPVVDGSAEANLFRHERSICVLFLLPLPLILLPRDR